MIDEGLLTNRQYMKLIGYFPCDGHDVRKVAKAQRDLTASIKDAECQKEVDKAYMRGKQELLDNMDTPEFQGNLLKNLRPAMEAECQERVERIFEWGNEPCDGDETHWGTIYEPPKSKRQCLQCWQALKEGVK